MVRDQISSHIHKSFNFKHLIKIVAIDLAICYSLAIDRLIVLIKASAYCEIYGIVVCNDCNSFICLSVFLEGFFYSF